MICIFCSNTRNIIISEYTEPSLSEIPKKNKPYDFVLNTQIAITFDN